jgi:hypothetical protein
MTVLIKKMAAPALGQEESAERAVITTTPMEKKIPETREWKGFPVTRHSSLYPYRALGPCPQPAYEVMSPACSSPVLPHYPLDPGCSKYSLNPIQRKG